MTRQRRGSDAVPGLVVLLWGLAKALVWCPRLRVYVTVKVVCAVWSCADAEASAHLCPYVDLSPTLTRSVDLVSVWGSSTVWLWQV